MIAVMGAAGQVGGKVAGLLLDAGHEVRVLEHRRALERLGERGAEVVAGDATDRAPLRALFRDAEAALVLLPDVVTDPSFVATRARMSQAIVEALRDTGVGHVVMLSTVGADDPDAAGPPAGLHQLERGLAELELDGLLVLRSSYYMENLLAGLALIRSQRINGSAVAGDLPLPMVATQDVAHEAAARLRRRDFSGHEVRLLLGPEDVTMEQATRAIGERLGLPDLPYLQFLPAEVKGALQGAGMSEEAASQLVELQLALNRGWPFGAVRRTPGTTAPTRLETFLKTALPNVGRTP
jgi:uncharacterized protein YbjT (DUF2867 family)